MEKKRKTVPYHKKPVDLSIEDWQTELRRQFAVEKSSAFIIGYLDGAHPVFSDYSVTNPVSGGVYKIALRSNEPGPNFCSCMDFKINLLGTCKHIEVILHQITNNKKLAKLLKEKYQPSYSSLYLRYGETRKIALRIGIGHKEEFEKLAKDYFDSQYYILPNGYGRVDNFLKEARNISPDFRCYNDAMDFIIEKRDDMKRNTLIDQKIDNIYLDNLLKSTTLYPYQKAGIVFAARAGRSLIADEMGLGKTIQAIGVAELLKKEFGISKILTICPTSLKYQWKSEIEKFTNSKVMVIEGSALQRRKQYGSESFYKIVSYGITGLDHDSIKRLEPDLIILDEAQRIKNWQTQTAKQVKKLESQYALVLTGTPIENKLEELYSIVQFIDPFRLGPLYRFLEKHQIVDEKGKVIGYKNLHGIKTLLSDIVLRRTKKDVLTQLPKRTDKNLFVPLTEQQSDIHTGYADQVARLVSKWKRFGFLNEKDRQRLLLALNCMRMVSDSTYILDQETRFDTKITEVMAILDDVFAQNIEKVVVFSQWERMTRLVGAELDKRNVMYSYLHGGILSHKRKPLLENFHNDPACRVFLSTDAGGVGLNLQSASMVINLDIPWNPAVLEQRIGRVHRHGQTRNINVINLISSQSIEERLLDILKFKSSLFKGVLDQGDDRIFMGESKFKRFMSSVEEVAVVQTQPMVAENDGQMTIDQPEEPVAELFKSAGSFMEILAKTLSDTEKTKQIVSSLVQKDEKTGKKYLKIPVENEEVVTKVVDVLGNFLSLLKK